MEHERLWDLQRFTQTQLRVATQQWQRDLDELLDRALVTLQEAKHAHQEELKLHRDRQHQQDICLNLREKVSASCEIPCDALLLILRRTNIYSSWQNLVSIVIIFVQV